MRSGFTNFCAQSWAVTWAWAKTRAQQHPAGWQSCCMRHSNEAEWSKFLESCNGTLCPPPTQCSWEIQMYYLCSHLRIKAVPPRRKVVYQLFFVVFFSCTYYCLLLSGFQLKYTALWCGFIHCSSVSPWSNWRSPRAPAQDSPRKKEAHRSVWSGEHKYTLLNDTGEESKSGK